MKLDLTYADTQVEALGEPKVLSPILKEDNIDPENDFTEDTDQVLINVVPELVEEFLKKQERPPAFELAGARKKIFFDPSKVRCALVTCGGLCPGLNDIIRAVVLELYYRYNVKNIYGIRYGLEGFIPEYGHDIMDLTPDIVSGILNMGGSILGSSRGPQSIEEIVDSLERMSVGILFMIGGDGTLQAATKIADEITRRSLKISVVGIPKTIDNDIYLISRSFGFDTAVDIATEAIKAAHNEAEGYRNGIGLIKLMGRHSGFIAATAALARQDVNFVLIPEIDFDLEGESGLLTAVEQRLEKRKHAVIVVAEGAGQKFFKNEENLRDASGNIKLKDIGIFLKDRIIAHFKAKGMPISLKYIDPSYMIRSLPANANDSVFCGFLGRDAVHAGMAGKTKLIVGHWNNHFVHVPMPVSVGKRKNVTQHSKLWRTVLEATGQGGFINHKG
ncbi:MAG: ATP-dependent 6-phosphofructokinase [Thermodesulfobacteriota bacterium]|nr:ATP-dependent 6-phosphofructokinase [Thermodesulfobacteriota bacterium]